MVSNVMACGALELLFASSALGPKALPTFEVPDRGAAEGLLEPCLALGLWGWVGDLGAVVLGGLLPCTVCCIQWWLPNIPCGWGGGGYAP